jgi:hypothetical protein
MQRKSILSRLADPHATRSEGLVRAQTDLGYALQLSDGPLVKSLVTNRVAHQSVVAPPINVS